MKKLLTLALGLITVTVLTGASVGGTTPWFSGSTPVFRGSMPWFSGSTPVFSGSTPWFNRDQPGGVGDYETTRDLLTVQCRFTPTQANPNPNQVITEGSPVGYHCNIKEGGWCKNNDPAGHACRDMQVKFSWAGGATPWLNRDLPGGVGDYETIKDLLTVSCGFTPNPANPSQVITEGSPVGYHCKIPDGGWCKNGDPAGLACKDMQVKFNW